MSGMEMQLIVCRSIQCLNSSRKNTTLFYSFTIKKLKFSNKFITFNDSMNVP